MALIKIAKCGLFIFGIISIENIAAAMRNKVLICDSLSFKIINIKPVFT
jgi:hypothetical protein